MIRRAALAATLAISATAAARPGGGHAFSGGGGRYSGGGGYHGGGTYSSVNGDTSLLLLIVLVVIVIVVLYAKRAIAQPAHFTTAARPPHSRGFDPAALVARDPAFSIPVLEDFAYQLYAAAQRARADAAALARLAPYLSPQASAQLAARHGVVEQVVVGALAIEGYAETGAIGRLALRIEADLAGSRGTTYAVEHWVLARATDRQSRPPGGAQTWPCPNCGAPWSPSDRDPRTCGHCGEHVQVGRFDWAVEQIWVDSETAVGRTLTGTVAEVGNDFPTIVHPAAHDLATALTADDPEVTFTAFAARARMIYARLNETWNAHDLGPMRGLCTTSLLDYLRFWLDEYRRQGLSNQLAAAEVKNIQLAKVVRDRYFDAITVRIFADGFDYTEDAHHKVVGGSRDKRRPYTEYWTFLRASARRGKIVAEPSCPNCGAPLAIGDRGTCTHCNAELENGSFDWTLSKIEQDDVYRG
ncbi:MAG TPA: TIM44-like domain-containing protein [Kofleriaceae bacterium]|nr:TIM44-like domain-containing protein [Kofleriaceae bacterium]